MRVSKTDFLFSMQIKFVYVVHQELKSSIQAIYHLFIIRMYVLNPLRDSYNCTGAVQPPEYESKKPKVNLSQTVIQNHFGKDGIYIQR